MRQAGDVLIGGASGAGGLLLNTKASQEAACSRAPAAIVPVRSLNHATQVWMSQRAMQVRRKVQVAADSPKMANT